MPDPAPAPRLPFYKSRKFYICCATIMSALVMFAQHQISAAVFQITVVTALTAWSAGIALEDHGQKSGGTQTSVATGSGDVTLTTAPTPPTEGGGT